MLTLEKFEIVPLGPCRFIGKSVYARAGAGYSGQIFGGLWGNSAGIFAALNAIAEYAAGETDGIALLTWDKYDERKKLLGYTVGRFMKADTPVPDGLDYFDIPAAFVAKGWVKGEFDEMIGGAEALTFEAIGKQEKYVPNWDDGSFMAEVYTKETVPEGGVVSRMGYYIGCKVKE